MQIISFALFLLLPSLSFAAVHTVKAVGEWILENGLDEDVNIVRDMALNKAMRNASLQVGARVDASISEKNHRYISGESEVRAAKVLKVNDQQYTHETIEEGILYRCHIVAMVDDAELQALTLTEEDIKQAIQLNRDKDELYNKMKECGQQMKVATTEPQRVQIRQQVKTNETQFAAIQLAEKADQMFWNIRVRQDRGMAVSQAEKEEVIALCNQAIVIDPACAHAYATLGLYYTYITKDYEAAFSVLKQGWANVPKESRITLNSAIEHLFSNWSHGRGFEHAFMVKKRIVNAFPVFIKYFQMWATNPPKEHIDEIAQCFREYWEADPVGRYEQYYRLMTSFYRKTEGDERALECLEEGLASLPDGHSGFELYASKACRSLYMGKGKDPEIAIEFFDRGITSGKMDNSELARLYSLKADCYKKLQDTEAWRENIDLAIAAWNYSIENEPSDVEGTLKLATKYEFRARCYEKIEAWREAKRDYEKSYALSKNESTLNKIREMESKLK